MSRLNTSDKKVGFSWKGLFYKNLTLKFLALFFSLILWFLVVGEKKVEVGLMISLGLKGIPEEMVVIDNSVEEIEVRVIGHKGIINDISPAELSASVDLSGAVAGSNTYRLSPGNIKMPSGIDVVRIRPFSVDVKLESLERKSVPVKVKFTGKPAKGFQVKSVLVLPSEGTVIGRKKDLKKVGSIKTTPIDITGILTDNSFEEVLLDISGKPVKGVEPESVTVTITVEEKGKGK
ncbi:MAG: hypothetical protein KAS88_03290 [Deltaproteobacteria bacterium]|nr:hypothetical protein [Deltaproteobacteria bacterium]